MLCYNVVEIEYIVCYSSIKHNILISKKPLLFDFSVNFRRNCYMKKQIWITNNWMRRLLSIMLAILTIMSIGCISAFAKWPEIDRFIPTISTTGATDNSEIFCYDFPYYNQSEPTIVGTTMNVFARDGIFEGETSPLQATSSTDVYSFNFNGTTYYCVWKPYAMLVPSTVVGTPEKAKTLSQTLYG